MASSSAATYSGYRSQELSIRREQRTSLHVQTISLAQGSWASHLHNAMSLRLTGTQRYRARLRSCSSIKIQFVTGTNAHVRRSAAEAWAPVLSRKGTLSRRCKFVISLALHGSATLGAYLTRAISIRTTTSLLQTHHDNAETHVRSISTLSTIASM